MKEIIKYLENNTIYNQNIILSRSLLAFGALITIIFNNPAEMTNKALIDMSDAYYPYITQFSVFSIFDPYIAKYFSIVILLFVFTGLLPQLSSVLQSWIHLSICNSFIIVDGGDQIASNISLLLIPICLFDQRFNQWDNNYNSSIFIKNRNVFFGVYYFLIKLQIAVIYLHAGVGKLYKDDWKNGTSIYYWFTHNIFGAPVTVQKFLNFFTLSPFSPIISWLVIFLELGLFACILATNKKIKLTFLFLGLFFHFSIYITHGLLSFFFSMAGALILYLDDKLYIFNLLKQFIWNKIIIKKA